MTEQELEEIRQDMLYQAREEESHEIAMRRDWDYFEKHSQFFAEFEVIYHDFRREMEQFGWDFRPEEVV